MPPRYEIVWVQHAAEQFHSLPQQARQAIMSVVATIQQDPHEAGRYDPDTDRYSAHFTHGDVTGMVMYVVAEQQLRVVMLRVTVL